MLKRIVTAALIAGFAGGVCVSLLQSITVTPLILEAETYENGESESASAPHEHHHDDGAHAQDHGEDAWAPEDGLERVMFTTLANIITATGFSLLLCACYALYGRVDARQGVLWGIAGFAAFQLAPAIGLPPEVPGSVAAPLPDRQIWWLATVAATAAGIALAVFHKKLTGKIAGAGLVLLPHLIGAPRPESYGGAAPPELAAHFAVAALVTGLIFWAFLGGISGFLFQKLEETP